MSAAANTTTERSTRERDRELDALTGAWIPVCRDCGEPIRSGEPRGVVKTRFVVCQKCLYERERT